MKTLKYLSVLFVSLLTFSCSSDDETTPVNTDELNGLVKIQEFSNDTHTVEFYSKSGTLKQGYNALSLRIKDKDSIVFVTNASLICIDVMYMANVQHSCTNSEIVKTNGK